ncbi:MAG: LPS export ABC transporter permease LptF, partial [Betaproteobacteria bacterium]|nr:LPS export ABC transporter permease LptF [Betaproteobacteria bacterium]
MIFVRSALREFTASGVVVFVVLLAITFTTQLIRFLGQAAGGRLPADAVLTMLGFSALGYLPLLLSIALFLSILLTMSRVYRDSEMVVWFSTGAGLTAWFRPVLLYAAPVTAVVALLSLSLTPWAIGKSEAFRHQIEARDDISAIAPGIFKESKQGDRVFFVEKLTSDLSQVANIFMHSIENQQQGVTIAQRSFVDTHENGDRYMVMLKGRRYEGLPGQADYKVVNFARYSILIEQGEARA